MVLDAGIRVIFGKFGKGKSTLNSMFACSEMNDLDRYDDSLKSIEMLSQLKSKSYSLPPQKHIVSSSYKIKYQGKESYDFDPDNFMLPNDDYDYNIYPPYMTFHCDEAQSGRMCAYDWSKFPKPAFLAFSRLRHAHYLWTLDLQFVSNLNKNLRKFAFEYLVPLNIENEYNCLNQLVKTSVIVGVFYSYNKAEKYEEDMNDELFEEYRIYTHNGDIYSCFDSYGKLLEFFDSDKDFSYSKVTISDIKSKNKLCEEIIL